MNKIQLLLVLIIVLIVAENSKAYLQKREYDAYQNQVYRNGVLNVLQESDEKN